MQRLTIDLKKNTEVADLVADKEPGESIYAELSIVSKDDQSLVVEIDAVGETSGDLDGEDSEEDEAEDAAGEDDGDEAAKPGDKMGEE